MRRKQPLGKIDQPLIDFLLVVSWDAVMQTVKRVQQERAARAPVTVSRTNPDKALSPPAAPMRSGGQGRPTSMHLIDPELKRRRVAGETLLSQIAEATALVVWLVKEHPGATPPTPKTVTNSLREELRAAVAVAKQKTLKEDPK